MNTRQRIRNGIIGSVVCIAFSILGANPAFSQVIEEDWEFTIVPYAWTAGIDGSANIGDATSDLNVEFSDIWDDLSIGGMLQLEAGKNVFGLFAQPTYLQVNDDDILDVADSESEIEIWEVEFGAFYRLAESKGDRVMTFDFLIGGRYWDLSTEIKGNGDGESIDQESRKELIDPMVGFRLEAYMTDRLYFSVRGDVGGFNMGSSTSNASWQVQGMFGLDVGKMATVFLGYRDLNVDYDTDESSLDLSFHGPIFGIGLSF